MLCTSMWRLGGAARPLFREHTARPLAEVRVGVAGLRHQTAKTTALGMALASTVCFRAHSFTLSSREASCVPRWNISNYTLSQRATCDVPHALHVLTADRVHLWLAQASAPVTLGFQAARLPSSVRLSQYFAASLQEIMRRHAALWPNFYARSE